MGMLVKEIREDYNSSNDHKEQFHFYVAGDFFNDDVKGQQSLMHWCLIDLEIEQSDILSIESPEEQRNFFLQQL